MIRSMLKMSIIIGCMVVGTPHADTCLKYKKTTDPSTTGGTTTPATTSEATAWIGKNQASFEDGEGRRIIMTYSTRTLAILDLQNKTWSLVKIDSVQSMISDAIEANAQDAAEAAAMKAMMQGMMGAMAQGSMTVVKTAEQQKIGAWQCTKYLIDMKLAVGATSSESWMTEQIKVDASVLNMAKNGILAMMPGFGSIKKEIEKIKGVPVKTISKAQVMNTTVTSTELLQECTEKPAPDGIYSIPKGFTEKSLLGD
jgi:hypothetical protein